MILVGALSPPAAEGGGREIFATLTVARADLAGPPRLEDHDETDAEGRLLARTEVTQLSDQATRVKRLGVEPQGEGKEPLPVLMIQYLMQTRYGALAMAFSTTHEGMFGQRAQDLFLAITQTGYIGERRAPF